MPTVRELFESLVELAPEARREALAGMRLDETQRARLEAMLASDGNGTPMLDVPVAEAVERLRDDEELWRALIGRQIGSFRVLSLLGEGGSSVVFRAEREAGAGSQFVALKLLRSGLYSADAQRRFRREQAILAQLSHPNIARLIEGGVSDAGIPYIAMELVEGATITRDADARALPLAGRLRLMATLCRALESAHAALVVHRDLKPANVLVTRDGELKVLDFGIARLLEGDEAATRTQAVMLTPGYAAPEQHRGEAPTTAMDVYALGVLLGELVTGVRLGAEAARASDRVTTGEATAPRGLPDAPLLARRLRGDLDAIIATALAEEPARRYRSAGALADDIERHLAGQPVLAHAPSRWYRTRKFVTRHRGGVALTLLFLVGILVSLSLALWQRATAQRAARAAVAEAKRADSMRDFMFDAFADVEPGGPRDAPLTVSEAVERAIRTAKADREADPAARIELLVRLAQVLSAQGEVERAAALLAATEADAGRELGPDHVLTLEAAAAGIGVAVGRDEFVDARARIDALLPRVPESAPALRARLLRHSASVAIDQRARERALRDSRLALELGRGSGDREELPRSLRNLANVHLAFGELDEAIASYEELLALQRARYGEVHAKVAAESAALSRAYRRSGDLQKAEAHARAAVEIDRQVYAGDHWHTALHLNALTMVLLERRAYDEAFAAESERLRILSASHGDDYLGRLLSLTNLGVLHTLRGRYQDALPHLREAVERFTSSFGMEYWATAGARAHLGVALAGLGDRDGAERALDQAIAIAEKLPAANSDLLATTLERRSRVALDFQDPANALALMDRCRAALASLTPTPYWDGRVDTVRGEALLALGRVAEAGAALETAARDLAASEHPDAVLRIANPLLLAAVANAGGETDKARVLAQPARVALAALPYPPPRLSKLAESLP